MTAWGRQQAELLRGDSERNRRAKVIQSRWGRQIILDRFDGSQVPERVGAYTGSNKAFSVEHHTAREEQLLQTLPLFERRLDPEVSRAATIDVPMMLAKIWWNPALAVQWADEERKALKAGKE